VKRRHSDISRRDSTGQDTSWMHVPGAKLVPHVHHAKQHQSGEKHHCKTSRQTQLEEQKQIYDHKAHGSPLEPNTLAWLHCTVIPRGGLKLHYPWKGPWRVLKCTSHLDTKQKQLVLHFDHLKPVVPGARFDDQVQSPLTTPDKPPPTNP